MSRPTCGHPIQVRILEREVGDYKVWRILYIPCTKRVGHATPPFRRKTDKEHKAVITEGSQARLAD